MASSLSRISALHNHISPLEANNNKLRSLVKIISPQVSEAISNGRAVVALESTIISHGMPYPQNLQTAKEVESIVRENGAVPATIAILYGVPCIGGNKSKWCNYSLCNVVFRFSGWHPSFCNRGIGGVHRHADHTMDISSDLTALGRTPIAVISAGETQEVYVAAYKSDEFPAFFTEKSGCKAPSRVDCPEDCARVIDANMKLNCKAGILFAVPIPKQHSAAGYLIESATQRALTEAREQNVTGNAETPFLLARISPQVSEAISNGRAVVALESTIISHGMPYLQNLLQTAKEVESIVRDNGVVPATIAILNGVPCIAMDISSDLTALGRTPIAVISAGVKSILDIPKTLRYLETQEVYVAAYKSDECPAFFTEKKRL